MKKKIIILVLSVLTVLLAAFGLAGCGFFGKDNDEGEKSEYTIIYSDGENTHTLKVKQGDVYTIDNPLPSKPGYEFLGLYDAEVGGTQYVSSLGTSVSAFNDKYNITLFPHFAVKEYVINLNYGESEGSIKSVTVKYDDDMLALPNNLVISGKPFMDFNGWYTQADCGGACVTNSKGTPNEMLKSFLASSGKDETVTLYAGFKLREYEVKLYSRNGQKLIKTLNVQHGKSITSVVSGIVDEGITITSWSTEINSLNSVFSGEITEDKNLYAYNGNADVALDIANCKQDNGYNPIQKAPDADTRARHNGFELVKLKASNIQKINGKYSATGVSDLKLQLEVLQNPSNLPSSGFTKQISVDDYSGSVHGTNISGKKINKGAYYVCVRYSDDSVGEANATDIFNGKNAGNFIDLNVNIDKNKTVKSVSIVVVYEIYSQKGLWHEHSNWRCTTTLEFN